MTERDADVTQAGLVWVVTRLEMDLGPQESWPDPVRLESLAQCVMNSIFSTGNRSEGVVRVLDRYRQRRRTAGHDPALDGPAELLDEIQACGGPEGFAQALGARWRAWPRREAPRKSVVIQRAAELLVERSVNSHDDLVVTLEKGASAAELKSDWLALPGQCSGLTWRYFLMNAGMPGIKADRMITRWTERALGRPARAGEAEALLKSAARSLEVAERHLDHALWDHERAVSGGTTGGGRTPRS